MRIFLAYIVVLFLAVPWYWPSGNKSLLLGMPAWAALAILIAFIAALLTSWIYCKYPWRCESENTNRDESDE